MAWFGLVLPWLWSWIIPSMAKQKKMVKMSKTKQMKNPSFQHFERYFFNLFISHFCKFFRSSYTRNHYQDITKPNQSKSSLYRPFLGVFDPFLGQNTQKPIVIDLKEHSIWKYTYVWSIFHWSHFWANLFLLDTLLTTCEQCNVVILVL